MADSSDGERHATRRERRMRVLIVDDHPLVREGLQARIDDQPDMEVCGTAADAQEALRLAKSGRPQIAIVDLTLRSGDGLELIKRLRSESSTLKILVVSAHDELMFAERALRAGAHGYLNKQELQGTLLEALRTVRDDKLFITPAVAQRLAGLAVTGRITGQGMDVLSDRELEVFRLIGEGGTTRSIAERLHVSPHTVESHRERIRHKLHIASSAELVRHALHWVLENTR